MIQTEKPHKEISYLFEVKELTPPEHLESIACIQKIIQHAERHRNAEKGGAILTTRILHLKHMLKVHISLLGGRW